MNLELYESPGLTGKTVGTVAERMPYVLTYTPDNMNTFTIAKESDVMRFPLPIGTADAQDIVLSDIIERIDLVAISGIECNIDLSFWILLVDISTLLNLVSNDVNKSHMIKVNEWSTGGLTNYQFFGRVASIRISQAGGTPTRLECSMKFVVGQMISFW